MVRRIVDLTSPISSDHVRWKTERRLVSSHQNGDAAEVSWIGMPVHAFTHIDAGRHFAEDGFTTSDLKLDDLVREAAIVDLSSVVENEAIDANRLASARADIRAGDVVLLKSCWDARMPIDRLEYWTTAPYLTADAARWLFKQQPAVIGFDFPQDYCIRDYATGSRRPALEDNVTHVELLLKGVPMIEYLCNMSAISCSRVQFIGLPLKIPDCDGAPIRAIAIEE